MQIDFQKETACVSEMVINQTNALLVEGDVIVPDIKPDMKEILLTEATAVITNQSYADGLLTFSGVVSVKILYVADNEDGGPKSIETKFDFKDVLECSKGENVDINVKSSTEHVEFSLINSRKMNVKVVVSVLVRGYKKQELTLLTGCGETIPLCTRHRNLSTYQVIGDEFRDLTISEILEFPGTKPDIDEIVKLSARAFRGDCKIMAGKMILKGMLVIETLYKSPDKEGGIEMMEHELPFSEMIEFEGINDDCLCHVSYDVKDVFYSIKEDAAGDPRMIALDVVVRADVMASKTKDSLVIDDCYARSGELTAYWEKQHYDEVLSEGASHLNLKEILSLPEAAPRADTVYSLDCKAKVQELSVENETLMIRGKLAVFVLYGSSESTQPMHSLVGEFDFTHNVPADGADESVFCECGITDRKISFSLNAASEIELRCALEFYTRVIKKKEISLLSGCELSEEQSGEVLVRRGPVIYFAGKGDTLWDVAKRYKADSGEIARLNRFENEAICAGQKILIPRN